MVPELEFATGGIGDVLGMSLELRYDRVPESRVVMRLYPAGIVLDALEMLHEVQHLSGEAQHIKNVTPHNKVTS